MKDILLTNDLVHCSACKFGGGGYGRLCGGNSKVYFDAEEGQRTVHAVRSELNSDGHCKFYIRSEMNKFQEKVLLWLSGLGKYRIIWR